MGDNLDKKAILEDMVFDEEEEFKKLVDKAKLIVNIKKSNGTPILLHKDKLNKQEQIACFVFGKYFAHEMELTDTSEVTFDEISEALNISKEVVRARLSDLNSKEIVNHASRGKYEISFIKLDSYLDNLLTKINKNKN
jgi:hypothetical protein